MSNGIGSMSANPVEHILLARIAQLESLLAEVKKTCGQNNCNCPRAPIIKKMAEAL